MQLSKVSQVSTYMYGQDGIKIRYKDALCHDIDGVKDGTFNVLVANPPYSVKGFLETLEDEDLRQYELTDLVSDRSKNNSIEVFFVERAKQLLKDGGVAAIILPSTILSNGGIYSSCREILLKYFEIIAIANFGSETFGKTNTNTATLFLKRRDRKPDLAQHYQNRVDAWFSGNFEDDDVYKDGSLIEQYCEQIGVLVDDYKTLLQGEPNDELLTSDLFEEYLEAFDPYKGGRAIKGLNEKAKQIKAKIKERVKRATFKRQTAEEQEAEIIAARNSFITEIEKEKLYYYMLAASNDRDVVIMKSPAKSADQKQFLGYEWSHAKGNEGIKYLNSDAKDDEDDVAIERLKGVDGIETPLFNPQDLSDATKINSIIRNNFSEETTIPAELSEYVDSLPLTSLINFGKVAFDKEIKSMEVRKTIISTKYDTEKLKNLVDDLGGLWTGEKPPFKQVPVIRNTNFTLQGKLNMDDVAIIDVEESQFNNRMLRKGDIIIEKSGGSETQAVGRVVLFDLEDDKYSYSNFTARLRIKESKKDIILPEYLHAVLNSLYSSGETFYYQGGSSGLKNLNLPDYLTIKIPVPSIEKQREIINACDVVQREFDDTKESIIEYGRKIEAIFNNVETESRKNGVRLVKIASNVAELNPEKGNIDLQDDDLISFVEMASVSNNGYIERMEDRKYKEIKGGSYTYFAENDIIIAKITPCMENGKCGIAAGLTNGIAFGSTEFHVLRCNDSYLPKYVFGFLNRASVRQSAERQMTGASGHRRVPEDFYSAYEIPDIPVKKQMEIVKEAEAYEKEIIKLRETLESLRGKIVDTFNSYM